MAVYSYEESLEQAKRQRAYIEALRKQNQQPEGQMVGGQYIAPHWTQQALPALKEAAAGYMSMKQSEKDRALSQSMQADQESWMNSRPQTRDVEVQGPPEAGMGQPTMRKEPTQQERLQWANRGTMNPLTKSLASAYGADVLIKEPEREEQREWKSSEARANEAARARDLELKGRSRIQELTLQLADKNLTRQQAGMIAKQIDDTKRWLGTLGSKTQIQVGAGHDAARIRAAEIQAQRAKDAEEKPPKQLPAGQSKVWTENNVNMKQANRALDMLYEKDSDGDRVIGKDGKPKINKKAEESMSIAYKLPFSEEVGQYVDPEGVDLRAAIAAIGSMEIHALSGAAVSAKEHPRLKPHVPSAGDTPAAAATKIENFLKVYRDIQQEVLDYADSQNYRRPDVRPGVTDPGAARGKSQPKVLKFNQETGKLE